MKRLIYISGVLFFIFLFSGFGGCYTEFSSQVEDPEKNHRDSLPAFADSGVFKSDSKTDLLNSKSIEPVTYQYFSLDIYYEPPPIGFWFYYPSPYIWDPWYTRPYRYYNFYYFWDLHRPYRPWRYYHDHWGWWKPWNYDRHNFWNNYWHSSPKLHERDQPGERRKDGNVLNPNVQNQKSVRRTSPINPERDFRTPQQPSKDIRKQIEKRPTDGKHNIKIQEPQRRTQPERIIRSSPPNPNRTPPSVRPQDKPQNRSQGNRDRNTEKNSPEKRPDRKRP